MIKNKNITRRSFLKTSAALMGAAVAGDVFLRNMPVYAAAYDGENSPDTEDATFKYVFSTCQNCHSRCGIVGKVKVTSTGHELVKIEGNPYHPNNMAEYDSAGNQERLDYADSAFETINGVNYLRKPGRLCPKGHAGVQVVYNPFRIKHPLKRVGNRGSGKWKTISWATAFSEIAARTKALITPWDQRMTTPIVAGDALTKNDDGVPKSIGPIANQFMFAPGRSVDKPATERFFKYGIGSANHRLDHTSICEVSHHVANYMMTQTNKKHVGGSKNHFKPDIDNSQYLIFLGGNPMEANFPMMGMARKIVDFKKRGGKLVVVDPRFSKTAAKADIWVPLIPATDGAFALGLCRYIIDNNKYDTTFLTNTNAADAAATVPAEKSWSDAAYLVVTDKGTSSLTNGYFLAPGDISAAPTAGMLYCYYNGATALEVNAAVAVGAQLEATDVTITLKDGVTTVKCSTVFSLVKARIQEKTLAEYATICGIDVSLFTTIGDGFTSVGKKAVANAYRGTVKHTNGVYSQMAVNYLNLLIGNHDWKGGNGLGGSSWKDSYSSSIAGTVEAIKGSSTNSELGVRIDRGHYNLHHEVNTILGETLGSPKRPWYPMAYYGLYQEIIPSISDQYPLPCKVYMSYWNAIPYSTPAAKTLFETTMGDSDTGDPDTMPATAKVPLYVAFDVEIGEASAWADYILPETTYLERWSNPGGTPIPQTKFTPLRQPMVGTFDDNTNFTDFDPAKENNYYSWLATKANTDDNDKAKSWPKMFEDILVGLGLALGLPGYATAATTDAAGRTDVHNGWDTAKMMINNLALQSGASVADIIAKGGVFADPGTGYSGDYLKSQWKGLLHFYYEQFIYFTNSLTNAGYDTSGLAKYETMVGVKGTAIDDSATYPYRLITYKLVEHGQARTANLPMLTEIVGENGLKIATSDAKTLGVKTGDFVTVSSPTGTYTGPDGTTKVKVIVEEGLRPGVVAFSHHFGHWEIGSRAGQTIDDTAGGYDSRRGKGIQLNPIMRTDPDITGAAVSLGCRFGGSVSFGDTNIKIAKV